MLLATFYKVDWVGSERGEGRRRRRRITDGRGAKEIGIKNPAAHSQMKVMGKEQSKNLRKTRNVMQGNGCIGNGKKAKHVYYFPETGEITITKPLTKDRIT